MFAARGIAVTSSIFFIVYLLLSLAVYSLWRSIDQSGFGRSPRRRSNLLFGLRMFPLAAASAVTAVFAVPSFLLLEPRSIHERVGVSPMLLGACGFALISWAAASSMVALSRTSRLVKAWTHHSQPAELPMTAPVFRITQAAPPLTAAGVFSPKVLLSREAENSLAWPELLVALRHEVAHVRRRDNLKKLLLRFAPFPGMRRLETAWMEATEIAADDAAVLNAEEALDLAAALIKLSRLSAGGNNFFCAGRADEGFNGDLMMAFDRCPTALITARIDRLLAWSESHSRVEAEYSPWPAAFATAVALAALLVTYSHLLLQVHEASEWLVK